MADTPPHNPEAEMCAIGCCVLSDKAIREVRRLLKPSHFYVPAHVEIVSALFALHDQNVKSLAGADLVLLKDELVRRGKLKMAGGVDYLQQCVMRVPSALNASHYAGLVLDKWIRREGIARSTAFTEACLTGESADVRMLGSTMLDGLFKDEPGGGEVHEILDSLDEGPSFTGTGIPTGLQCVDLASESGGLDRGFYGVFTAKTGGGKTYLGCQLAGHACDKEGLGVVYVTLELDKRRILSRIMKQRTGMFDLTQARKEGREDVWESAKQSVSMWDFYVDDYSGALTRRNSLSTILGRLEALHSKRPRDLAVIDFAQRIMVDGSKGKSYEDAAVMAGEIASFCARTGMSVWLLSQIQEAGDRENRMEGGDGLAKLASHWLGEEYRTDRATKDKSLVLCCRKIREGLTGWEKELILDRRHNTVRDV